MKKLFLVLFIIILIVFILLYFLGYTKSTNKFYPYSIRLSSDGSSLNFHVSASFVEHLTVLRRIKTKQVENKILVTIYSNRILPALFNESNEFEIKLDSLTDEIYFYQGIPSQEYYLAIKKNITTNEWEKVDYSNR